MSTNKTIYYQITNAHVISADRHSRGTSPFSNWVRENYAGKFIVSVKPFDSNGQFNHEPLKLRGYEFSGAGTHATERGLLAGKKTWFRVFATEQSASEEITLLTETGI